MTEPVNGDHVPMGSFFTNVQVFGEISDLDTPDQVSFTMEGYGSNAVLNTSVIRGPQGVTGSNAPLGTRMFPIFDSTDDLPNNLTDEEPDIGKYWIVRVFDEDANEIGSNWAMWNGTDYEIFKMGEPGQAGPVPNVTWTYLLVDDDDPALEGGDTKTVETGDNYNPSVTFYVNKELIRGPTGVAAPWGKYAEPTDPVVGNVPVWDGAHYIPGLQVIPVTKFWTIPEGQFTNIPLTVGTHVQVASFTIPVLPWDVVPVVHGHLRIVGIELDTDPLIVGAEVRLGDPITGTLVGRGFGNISTYAHIVPHTSTSTTTSDSITPDNARGVIPAGTTGVNATLYVSLYNDGLGGTYSFNNRGAQLSIQAIPV